MFPERFLIPLKPLLGTGKFCIALHIDNAPVSSAQQIGSRFPGTFHVISRDACVADAAVEGAPQKHQRHLVFPVFLQKRLVRYTGTENHAVHPFVHKGHKKLGFLLRIIIRVADYDGIVFLFQIIADAPDNLRIKEVRHVRHHDAYHPGT